MSVIRMLSLDVANKIAAGEVVERPASVVKELLENAVDAGASRIDLVVTAGGKRLVSVVDDGSGMCRDDVMLAPERQATSKLRSAEDLGHIETMGFRGEALASIASVSRFTIKSRRREDDTGTELYIEGGTMRDVGDCGCPPGTMVEVRDLFYNLPARRAFLRSFTTEIAHIKMQFIVHAIALHGLTMNFTSDGDPVYRLRPASSLFERLCDLFGSGYMDSFVPVDYTHGDIKVSGYAGVPGITRGDTQGQYIFINGRPATAPVLQAAIRESYPQLDAGRRPVLFLFIDIPVDKVDVNVHPTKREVRFRSTSVVREAVLFAIASALKTLPSTSHDNIGGFSSIPNNTSTIPVPQTPSPTSVPLPFAPIDERTFASKPPPSGLDVETVATGDIPPLTQSFITGANTTISMPITTIAQPSLSQSTTPVSVKQEYTSIGGAAPWTRFRYVGRLSSGYAILDTDGGYVIVDPAAAHERVIYERLLKAVSACEGTMQDLLLPQNISFTPLDAERVRSLMPILVDMGFDIEDFGGDAFVVRSLPSVLSGSDARQILEETCRALEDAGPRKGRDRWREKLVAEAASRSAVRTHKPLDDRALLPIIMELAACQMPYATPSGRPTIIFTSTRELDRKFGRTPRE